MGQKNKKSKKHIEINWSAYLLNGLMDLIIGLIILLIDKIT